MAAKTGYTTSVTITRPNDTSNYGAGDVVGAATDASAAREFVWIGPRQSDILITSVQLEVDASAVISGETSYRLHLYSATPASAFGDNTTWDLSTAADRAIYLGFIDLGTPVDLGSTLYVEANGVNKHLRTADSTSIFGYLVTTGAHTPTANRVYKVTLHSVLL